MACKNDITVFSYRLFIAMTLIVAWYSHADAEEEPVYMLSIYFKQGISSFDPNFRDNGKRLERALSELTSGLSGDTLSKKTINVRIEGGASPEGSVKLNEGLSRRRADQIYRYVKNVLPKTDVDINFKFHGRDWGGLLEFVKADSLIPYREELIDLLQQIVDTTADGETEKQDNLNRLKRLRNGVPYRDVYSRLFPELRKASVWIDFADTIENTPKYLETNNSHILLDIPQIHLTIPNLNVDVKFMPIFAERQLKKQKNPFYMDIRTNMLFDVVAIPNIGVEFYLGKGWSAVADWQYGWWKTDPKHVYWRFYGGDIALRKWVGKRAMYKPLTGHHLGLYGQIYTYDIDLGGEGQMGGKPGGNLWDKYHWGAGFEYGYSLPVGKRLNIDFTLGIGYTTGYYHVYKPIDDHYVWQYSGIRHWFGPTKAEISLAWLVGRGNYNMPNKKKGGGI